MNTLQRLLRKEQAEIDAKTLRYFLDYDPETGEFTWRVDRNGLVRAGDIAGTVSNCGSLVITLYYVRYTAARLAWLHYYGTPAPGEVAHGAGGQLDNSIKNLSVKPHGTHRRTTKVSTESGAKGVNPNNSKKNPWRARVATGGRQQVNLGSFPCITKAAIAYDAYVKENLGPEHITNEQLGFFKYGKACDCCY